MSYALSVYRVPQMMLTRTFGKNDSALLTEALEALREELADYDAQMDAPDLENNDVDLSHADVLVQRKLESCRLGVSGCETG